MKQLRLNLLTCICGIAVWSALSCPAQSSEYGISAESDSNVIASSDRTLAPGHAASGPKLALKKADPAEGATPPETQLAKPDDTESDAEPAFRRPQNEIVSFGKSIHLKSNEVVDALVVIGGSANVEGKVRDAVVAIGGHVTMSGEAQSVVAILGNVTLSPGAKSGETVVVGGNLRVEDNAQTGDAVSVGGAVTVAPSGIVTGEKVSLGLPGFTAPEWAQAWFKECFLKMRPLAPGVGWVWGVAAVAFLFYLTITLAFGGAVGACLEETFKRPATTLLVGVLSKVLIPLVILVLIGTGIGIVVVPFVILAGMVIGVLGKAGIIQAIGAAAGRALRSATMQKPLVAFLTGSVALVLLFMIPVVGFIVFVLVGTWGLGSGVMATIHKLKRERPPGAAPMQPAGPNWPSTPVGNIPASGTSAVAGSSASAVSNAALSASLLHSQVSNAAAPGAVPPAIPCGGAEASPPFTSPPTEQGAPPTAAIAQPSAMSRPVRYAGFWERMGAAFLDIILVALAANFARLEDWWYLVALAYFSAMWTWRGTTIGGIVLGLRVARANGEAPSFAVAFVRALTAGFSALVLFLGFFWIGWDKDKQAWHDKVAGTVVVKSPKSVPLIC